MDCLTKAKGLMPSEVYTDNQRIAAAQAYATIAQAEQLKRIADALYLNENRTVVRVLEDIGMTVAGV